jgi:hypothetical protein
MMPSAMKIGTRTVPPIVIPAKAGIHGFDQSAMVAFLNTGRYLGEREMNSELPAERRIRDEQHHHSALSRAGAGLEFITLA